MREDPRGCRLPAIRWAAESLTLLCAVRMLTGDRPCPEPQSGVYQAMSMLHMLAWEKPTMRIFHWKISISNVLTKWSSLQRQSVLCPAESCLAQNPLRACQWANASTENSRHSCRNG